MDVNRHNVIRLAKEIVRLWEMKLEPAEYYREFLPRLLAALGAMGGAVWVCTPDADPQLQYEINMDRVGLNRTEDGREMHTELLRQAAEKGQSGTFMPHTVESGARACGNPSDYVILITPIFCRNQVSGLVEVWQEAACPPDCLRGYLQFMHRMASLS